MLLDLCEQLSGAATCSTIFLSGVMLSLLDVDESDLAPVDLTSCFLGFERLLRSALDLESLLDRDLFLSDLFGDRRLLYFVCGDLDFLTFERLMDADRRRR